MSFEVVKFSEWKVAHKARLTHRGGEMTFADTIDTEWHLMELSRAEFVNARLKLRIVARPTAQGNTWLYVNHWGAVDIGYISRTGKVYEGQCELMSAELGSDGRFIINVVYSLSKGTIYLGTAVRPGQQYYSGSGEPQWNIYSIECEATSLPRASLPSERLVLVDVGAAGGFDEGWAGDLNKLHCVLIEPDAAAAEALREELRTFPSSQVIEAALYDKEGPRTLNITRYSHCSSLLEPDMVELKRYTVMPCFEVIGKIVVNCIRYDQLEGAPAPDVIKIDVQGAEYEVLVGFGRHLDTVLCIELESHFYPIYKGQKLIGDLVGMLASHGLRLRRLVPQLNFDADITEVDAVFTREGELSEGQAEKMNLIGQKLGLKDNPDGSYLVETYGKTAANPDHC